MRFRPWVILSLALVLAVAVVGCAQKKSEDLTLADSTAFATNPTEQSAESLATQEQTPPPPPAAKAPAPKATPPKSAPAPKPAASAPAPVPTVTVPTGTAIMIEITSPLSSETANVGDSWTGVVKNNVQVGEKTVIPSGSVVRGIVTASKPATKGDRALLDIAISSMTVEGNDYTAHATTEAIVAGSTRARNLGAIAVGTGAGAAVGGAVGGKKGAIIGGLIGAAGSAGAVAGTKGYQVVLKEGTELTFNVTQPVSIKR